MWLTGVETGHEAVPGESFARLFDPLQSFEELVHETSLGNHLL
jgi:hypothetical protein